ncbi:unnamed protein product [Arabidopsis halleri]
MDLSFNVISLVKMELIRLVCTFANRVDSLELVQRN